MIVSRMHSGGGGGGGGGKACNYSKTYVSFASPPPPLGVRPCAKHEFILLGHTWTLDG